MPLSVRIAVNDRPIETLHIGRSEGGTNPNDLNHYLVVRSEHKPTRDEWQEGTPFTHRYGDGVEACVARALAALASARLSI